MPSALSLFLPQTKSVLVTSLREFTRKSFNLYSWGEHPVLQCSPMFVMNHFMNHSLIMRLNFPCLPADSSREDEFSRWRDRRNHNKPHQKPSLHRHLQHVLRDRDGRGKVCRCFLNKHAVCPSKWRTRPLSDSFTDTTCHDSRTVATNSGRLSQECF